MRFHGFLNPQVVLKINYSQQSVCCASTACPPYGTTGSALSYPHGRGLLGDEGGYTKLGIPVWSHDPIMRSRAAFTRADGAPQ